MRLFPRKKYNRWRIVLEQLFLGVYDPSTKEGFLLTVVCRNATSLVPLMLQWVRPRKEIWSDMWGA